MAQPASHSMSMQEEQSVEGGAPDSKIEERNQSKMDAEGEEGANSQMEEENQDSQQNNNREQASQISKSEAVKQIEKEPIMVSLK